MKAVLEVVALVLSSLVTMGAQAGNFYGDFDLTWGDQQAKISQGGHLLTLSLNKYSGSGFQSKNEYSLAAWEKSSTIMRKNREPS